MLALKRRYIIFTCRDVKTDFRWPLAKVLRLRDETWYIWLRRRPRVLRPGAGAAVEEISFPALLLLLIRSTRPSGENIYLNSTNTSFPIVMLLLQRLCGRGLWCLDMHDDLLYDMAGLRRLRAAFGVRLQALTTDIIIRAAESLIELFPASLPFGNASQIEPIQRSTIDYRSVLVLASLDSRFDFAFMNATAKASPSRIFEIYGSVSRDDRHIRDCMATLCESNPNIIYHGAYDLAGLEPILSRYSISLAPYCVNTRLTRYLDPLRYYHCLNSGMELITTSIPEAECLRPSLHVVCQAAEIEPLLRQLETSADAKHNTAENYRLRTWEERADDLLNIATNAKHAPSGRSRQRGQTRQHATLASKQAPAPDAKSQGATNPEAAPKTFADKRQVSGTPHDGQSSQPGQTSMR